MNRTDSNGWAIFKKEGSKLKTASANIKKEEILKRDEEDASQTTTGRSDHGSHRTLAAVQPHNRWSSLWLLGGREGRHLIGFSCADK